MQGVLDIVTPYANTPYVNKTSQQQARQQSYWIARLQKAGYEYDAAEVSYRDVYILLYSHSFDTVAAYSDACASNNSLIAMYLSKYVDAAARQHCVMTTRSQQITQRTELQSSAAQEVLLASANDVEKFTWLSQQYPAEARNIAASVIGVSPVAVQVVLTRLLLRDGVDVTPYISRVDSHDVGVIFEQSGHRFPPMTAVELGLPNSVRDWLSQHPHQNAVKEALRLSLSRAPFSGMVAILSGSAVFSLDSFAAVCARHDWPQEALSLIRSGANADKTLQEAIRSNSRLVCAALRLYCTNAHLRLSRSLGRNECYNALL